MSGGGRTLITKREGTFLSTSPNEIQKSRLMTEKVDRGLNHKISRFAADLRLKSSISETKRRKGVKVDIF